MTSEEFMERVKNKLAFLLIYLGYSITSEKIADHMDVCEVRFEDADIWLVIGRERGGVFIYIGSNQEEEISFTINELLGVLENEEDGIKAIPVLDRDADYQTKLDFQLDWYAIELQNHYEEINKLINQEENQEKLKFLVEQKRRRRGRLDKFLDTY